MNPSDWHDVVDVTLAILLADALFSGLVMLWRRVRDHFLPEEDPDHDHPA